MQNTQGAVFRRVCQQGNVELARQILATGVNIDAAQEDGCTALWLAAEAGQVATVVMLCEHEANMEAVKQPANVTALYIACQNGHIGVADVLLMHSANPNTTKANGSTPMHIAAQQGFVDICRILLRYGAKHSPRNIQGVIPLHLAAYQGNEKVVRLLLAAGADPMAESQGKYTIDWAITNGHGKAVQRAIEEVTGQKMTQDEPRDVVIGVGGGGDGLYGGVEGSPAAGMRGHVDMALPVASPVRSAIKQPFMVQMRDEAGGPSAYDASVVNMTSSRQPMSGWYVPSFLNQSVAASPSRAHYDASMSRSSISSPVGSRAPPSSGILSPSAGKGGFVATALPLSAAIVREAERNTAFRNRSSNNPEAGLRGAIDLDAGGDTSRVTAGAGVRGVEDNWIHFKRRLDNQRRFLNNTRNSIPDGWLYSGGAVEGYRKEVEQARAELAKAAEEGRVPPKRAEGKTSNCVGLDEEYLSRLRAFIIEGEGAKPPAPMAGLDQEDLALQEDPPSPGQFRGAHESHF